MSEPTFHQFKLRLPSELFQQLEAEAAAANRSVSAEMIYRLESSLTPASQGDIQREFLADMIFGSFNDEEENALDDLDHSSVEGMVAWLRLVDAYTEKRKKLEAMVDEAWAIFQKEKAEKEAAKPAPKAKKGKAK